MSDKESKRKAQKQIKIKRSNRDNIKSTFVNDLVITHNRDEFVFVFSEIEPPFILDKSDFDQLEEIEADARARLVVTPAFAEKILNTLSVNIEAYKNE